jgi:hypothetical protein
MKFPHSITYHRDLLVINPKHLCVVDDRPLLFLAGPIHAAPRWQDHAIRYLAKTAPDIAVATPRWMNWIELRCDESFEPEYAFFRQRPWEKYYMTRAAGGGAILFWLACPSPEYLRPGMVYSATTRFELGEWMTRCSLDPSIPLEIGAEEDFPTLRTIQYDLYDLMGAYETHKKLESLLDAAVLRARDRFSGYRPEPFNPELIKGLERV